MALTGTASHVGDGISQREVEQCGNLFDNGNVRQFDETTFGVKVGNREYRGDGIVYNTGEDKRDFNQVLWQENDGEDFTLGDGD